jgi:hypothetical protein
MLDAIQFEWDGSRETSCEVQWEINFNHLKKCLKVLEPGVVSTVEKLDKTLETWVANQRKRNHRGMLREDRKEKLASIGFSFGEPRRSRSQKIGEKQEEKWERMYQRLLDFKRAHGHTVVPYGYDNDKSLSLWVSTQRREYNQKSWYGANRSIKEDRKMRLEDIGFVWDANVGQNKAEPSIAAQEQPGDPVIRVAV